MPVKLESFLALEKALSKRMQASLTSLTKDTYVKVGEALKKGQWEEATRLLQAMQLSKVFEDNKGYVTYLTNLAMLFGASRVTAAPGTSVVGLGFEKNTAYQMVQTFQQSVTQKAEAYLKATGLQLIAQLQSEPATKAEEDNPQPDTTTSPKRRVLRDFQSFMDASGKAYFDMVSSLHTSRVSAYGFTAEAAALGIKEYQINEQLDNRICPVCSTMHGKKFKVRDARRLLEVVTRVTDPDDLKQLQPWPSQSKDEVEKLAEMSEEELIGKGWHIPPFHPKCRGLLVRVGKVPSLADIKAGKRTDTYQATEDDFAPFGIKPGDTLLQEWNSKVRVPPAEVAAVMGQVGIDEVLADLLSKMIPYLTEAKTAKTYVQVKGAAKIAEEMHLKQTLRFYGTKVALQELKDIPSDFDLKLYLRQLYTLAQDAGATSLEIVPDVGDLATLGFVASEGVNTLDFTNAEAMKKFLD